MGTKRTRSCLNDKNVERLSSPPGFVSLTSFILKRVEKSEETNNSISLESASKQEPIKMSSMFDMTDIAELKRSLQCRPWVLFDQSNQSLEKSESEQFDMVINLLLLVLRRHEFGAFKYYATLWWQLKGDFVFCFFIFLFYEYIVSITIRRHEFGAFKYYATLWW
jgi:hypothetical protein